MDNPGKYCCFICPEKDHKEKLLTALCPTCKNAYGFPLDFPPEAIGRYRIVKSLGRGFYAATFLCEYGNLDTQCVLKVSSKKVYQFFGRNFEDECRKHKEAAQDAEHIVPIVESFEEEVAFGSISLTCYIAVIDYIDGPTLDKFLEIPESASARSLAQIAIDLVSILGEFAIIHKFHNDLHSKNIIIQTLRDGTRRAVAIDLGSVGDYSRSDSCKPRFGDQHWLCRHLQRMINKLRETGNDIDRVDDLDNRIAEALERTLFFLLPRAGSVRTPTYEQLKDAIHDYLARGPSPWKEPLILQRFNDSYNAGALEPWYVPFLLVDPDDHWIQILSASGPLLITGMRGCGKTMLLRALDLHARAAKKEEEEVSDVLSRLQSDRYVGLFVSCINLLITPGREDAPRPFERLFLSYCLEAVRAVRHLKELDQNSTSPNYFKFIAEAVEMNMETDIDVSELKSDNDLDRFLLKTISSLKKESGIHTLKVSPADAFVALATTIRKCSYLWSASRVFFLLDDVSTRYLPEETIKTIFAAFVFQSPACAFKLTTEAQTLEIALHSPGLVERAREGRDYEIFDLGADVYKKTRLKKELYRDRKSFVEQILEQRARYYPNHPKAGPREILGNCTLEDVARKIASTNATSRVRKAVYHGISVLSAVCVGDIGDVINLYELILKKAINRPYPIEAIIQSDCYMELCNLRLYDLNRRETELKNFSLSFAEASHELLVKSHRAMSCGETKRLRQYTNIYVRVTAGDTQKQFKKLRELIDAGVFVMHGGTLRTKTRDGDPILQFKLTYRKLFGLSNFIGIAHRDRFELSGIDLEDWLTHAEKGKEILLRNLGGVSTEDNDVEFSGIENDEVDLLEREEEEIQQELPIELPPATINDVFSSGRDATVSSSTYFPRRVEVRQLSPVQLGEYDVELLVLGLGFEERTLDSAKRLLSIISPKQAILIKYPELGKGGDIKSIVSERVKDVQIVDYADIQSNCFDLPNMSTLVDVTGLAKPVLFGAVRGALQRKGSLFICHTRADQYYPLNDDIARVLEAEKNRDYYQLLVSLSKILTGEKGPYSIDGLLESDADESRRKVLFTFASAKHERLLSLLDARDYDQIEIIIPPKETPRSEIARIAAKIAGWNFLASGTIEKSSNDLQGIIEVLTRQYLDWYVERGFNVELGLTGSKIQAVACAIVSVECKIAQSWYVRPKEFDPKRFTEGIGDSSYYRIRRVREEGN